MPKKNINRYSVLEINTLLQLRASGLKIDEIVIEINTRFKSNRTVKSISCKLSSLTTRDNVKKTKKLTEIDKVLLHYINKYPTNIRHGVKLAAKKTGKSFNTLYQRYYKHLKFTNPVLTVGSKIGFSNNVKNSITDINGNLPTPDMNDVQWLMKQILNLAEDKRNQIKLLLT
jgi:hypothetical protein